MWQKDTTQFISRAHNCLVCSILARNEQTDGSGVGAEEETTLHFSVCRISHWAEDLRAKLSLTEQLWLGGRCSPVSLRLHHRQPQWTPSNIYSLFIWQWNLLPVSLHPTVSEMTSALIPICSYVLCKELFIYSSVLLPWRALKRTQTTVRHESRACEPPPDSWI